MKDVKHDNAYIPTSAAAYRTIPNAYKALSSTELDLAAVTATAGDTSKAYDLRGCWVMIQNASGGDLTVLRGVTGITAPSAGVGKVIKDGTTEEFFVSAEPGDGAVIRASGSGLVLLFDSTLAKAA